MVTSDLLAYIKTRRAQGISDEQIYEELKSHGWKEKDLALVLPSGHSKKSLHGIFRGALQFGIRHKLASSALILALFVLSIIVYQLFIFPYVALQHMVDTMQKISSVQYTGKTHLLLARNPTRSVELSFSGSANVKASQTQTTVSVVSKGFNPNFQGNGDLVHVNRTTYINIHQLHNVPLVNPDMTLHHWYVVSTDSARLQTLQQLIPSLAQKHLVTITHSTSANNMHRIDFRISHSQLEKLSTTKSLDHLAGTLWIDQHHLLRRVVFSTYLPHISQSSIHTDITLSKFNQPVTIKQPTDIYDSESGTSIYYLLKIMQSVLSV